MKAGYKKILTDIRFWIIFFFLIRLLGITNAPLEVSHNWRQSLTNMIARNFLEIDSNIFYPRIDMAGQETGIIGSEFPFFNYLIFLFSSIFDYSHWIGRLINLSVSSFGLFYFYRLVQNIFNYKVAFNATIVLSVSIWFAFSRKIMPDTFSVSLVMIGLYYAYNYLKNGFISSLIAFFLFATLGVLCKIPALSLLSVLSVILFIKQVGFKRKTALFIVASTSFFIVCLWYFYWVPYLLEIYHFQLYFPKSIIEGLNEISPLIPELLEKFYFSSLSSYLAFICCVIGIYFLINDQRKLVLFSIGITTVIFILFIIKTGAVFPLHNYYIIPFTPIMALLAGITLEKLSLKFQYIILLLISIEAIANQQHDFRIKANQYYKLTLEDITKSKIDSNELIIINGGQSPQLIYFSHCRGWSVDNADIIKPYFVDSLQALGAKYVIIDVHQIGDNEMSRNKIYQDENYRIYSLTDSN